MPLSVPLLLVPGEPDRHYTVHTQRARWDDAELAEHGNRGVSALMEAAREGLRFVSECVAAELADADVAVIQHPTGAEAVARVLCTEDECAAVAEQYRRDVDEDVEAEAARAWAATRLQDQTVEILRLREESEKATPGKTPAEMLAAVLAVQQERTGGSPDRVTLMLDEAAFLLRDNALFTHRSPEGVRRELDRLIRQNRVPYPPGTRWGKTLKVVDQQSSADIWVTPANDAAAEALAIPDWAESAKAHLDLPNAFHMAPEHLVRETETLARSVAAGETRSIGVKRLAELCGELARRHGAEPQPRPCPGPGGCREDDDPEHNLVHRIGYRPRAVPAGEVRAANGTSGPMRPLNTLPETLPGDSQALVLVYRKDTPGLGLLDAVLSGSEAAVQDTVTGLLRWLTADGK